MQLVKQPRKRINRFARILSMIYDVDYRVSLYVYNRTNREIDLCKLTLSEINRKAKQAEAELLFIDTHNLLF